MRRRLAVWNLAGSDRSRGLNAAVSVVVNVDADRSDNGEMDGPSPSVVRTDRISRLGHTAYGPDRQDSKILRYRTLVGIVFAVVILVVPIDLDPAARFYISAIAGLYIPTSALLIHRAVEGDRADLASSVSDIIATGVCCAAIPASSPVGAIAITATVVVAIPVHPRRLVGVLSGVGLIVAGVLAYNDQATQNWFLQPLVMAMLFPAFDLYLRDRRRQWDVSAQRYEALIHASEVFFWEIDIQSGAFVTAVGNCEGLLGYSPSELVGRRWTDFVVTKDVAAVAGLDIVEGRQSVTSTVVCRDGGTRVFRHTVEARPGARLVHGVSADISELAEATEVIRHQAERDHLTGLSNRMVLLQELDRVFTRLEGDSQAALLMLDLNRFKEVNDTLGHPAGDQLLRVLAARLEEELPEAAVIARLGGDEFAVLIEGDADRPAAVDVARRIHRAFQRKIDIEGVSLVASASIGIALLPEHASNTDDAIRCADMAMYESKRSDRTFIVYHEDPGQLTLDRLLLGSQIGAALDNGEFETWFHPCFELESGKLVGVETEPKWHHPKQGTLESVHFVELLELAGELGAFGRFVVSAAARMGQQLERVGLAADLAIVVPAGCLLAEDWLATSLETLDEHDIPRSRCTLRLTDISVLGDRVDQVRWLKQVAEAGLGVAAEELAAPCASPANMRDLPITEVKLEAGFITEINEQSQNLLFARTLIELGKLLGRTVVADGVADESTADVLRSLGCHRAQGPHLARAMVGGELLDFVEAHLGRSRRITL